MPETYGTLAEYMDVDVLMNLDNAFEFSKKEIVEYNKHHAQIIQQAGGGEANGLLGQTAPFFRLKNL